MFFLEQIQYLICIIDNISNFQHYLIDGRTNHN